MEEQYLQQIRLLKKASSVQPHPNFFIVGAAKAGTTSLWVYLSQHREIGMPIAWKEPSFFSPNYQIFRDHQSYLDLFAHANRKKAIGEASHAYLTSPESAELILQTYPDAKIIVVLRNPAERAFSLYQWMIREGFEWVFPFEKALDVEDARMKDEEFKLHTPQYYYNYLYYHSGLYSEQILRYTKRFPKEQIKIILYDDFKQYQIQIVQELCRFLGVDSSFVPVMEIHNKAKMPLWIWGQYFFRLRLPKLLKRCHVSESRQKKLVRYALAKNLAYGRSPSFKMGLATRRNLLNRYKDDIYKTGGVIGRSLEMWLEPTED